jgi:thymidylate synthase
MPTNGGISRCFFVRLGCRIGEIGWAKLMYLMNSSEIAEEYQKRLANYIHGQESLTIYLNHLEQIQKRRTMRAEDQLPVWRA